MYTGTLYMYVHTLEDSSSPSDHIEYPLLGCSEGIYRLLSLSLSLYTLGCSKQPTCVWSLNTLRTYIVLNTHIYMYTHLAHVTHLLNTHRCTCTKLNVYLNARWTNNPSKDIFLWCGYVERLQSFDVATRPTQATPTHPVCNPAWD